MRVLLFAILVALVLAAALFLMINQSEYTETPQAVFEENQNAKGKQEREAAFPSSDEPTLPSAREFLETPALAGIVRSTAGRVLQDAEVSWIALRREDSEWESIWQADEWGPLDRARLTVRSDRAGGFAFTSLPEQGMALDSVLVATCRGHAAGGLRLGSEPESWGNPVITLKPAEDMKVIVTTADGLPAAGALVEQFGIAGREASVSPEIKTYARFLFGAATTGPNGTALLQAFPSEQVLVASRDKERSAPWRGKARNTIELRLGATFSIEGQVSLPSWEHLDYEGERRIALAAQSGNLWRDLGTIRGVQEGRWGPLSLPLLSVDRYRVRLEGSPIIPVEEVFNPPAPGSTLTINLAAEFGINVNFRVVDIENRVIPEAKARIYWQNSGDQSSWSFVERGPAVDGNIDLWTVPPGTVIYEASAPGYSTYRSGAVSTASFEGLINLIQLPKAGRLHGLCLHRGEPVRDFEVITWQAAAFDSRQSYPFFDREDGRFEIESAPIGSAWITASSPKYPACAPVQLEVSSEESGEVVLELPDPLSGRGIVTDETTGDGLADARLQLYITGDRGPLQRWGLPQPVRPDGSFEIPGFVQGINYLLAEAPGYSTAVVSGVSQPDNSLDFGEILLSRRQDLLIRLTSDPSAAAPDYTTYSISGSGPEALSGTSFSPEGKALFEDVSGGSYTMEIRFGARSRTLLKLELRPKEDWQFTTRIAGLNRLSVVFLVDSQEQLKRVNYIDADYITPDGIGVQRGGPFLPGEPFSIEGIEASSVQATVYDFELEPITSVGGAFADGLLTLSIPLGDALFLVCVVNNRGDPLSGVKVFVNDPELPAAVLSASTDGKGECEIRGVPRREVVVHLQHSTLGSRYGIRCDASSGKAELVLEAESAIELEVFDGARPIPGVECAIVDLGGRSIALPATTDDQGRAEFPALAPGPCPVALSKAGFWPARVDVVVREEPSSTTVQIRELADLEVVVRAAGGLAVSGVMVELHSLEFDEDVAAWIAEERCESSGLSTDLDGRVVVRGLPRGSYRWSLQLSDGKSLEGEYELVPGEPEPLRIILPE